MTHPVTIATEELGSSAALDLIGALNAELSVRYPEPGATHFRLEESEVADDRGVFLIARIGSRAVGCGALRRIAAGLGEIKRMYVRPEARGHGVGRALLQAIESEAARLDIRRLVLETGPRQTEALALYGGAGYLPILPFGEYVGSPLSLCMGKDL